jgi:hypothetical protein
MTPRSLRKTFLGCKMGKRLLKVFTLLSKKKKKEKSIYISKRQKEKVQLQVFYRKCS